MGVIVVLMLCALLRFYVAASSYVVNTNNGKIEGIQTKYLHKFTNIPYAMPPIGKLRFLAPQKMNRWDDTLQATSNNIKMCAQYCKAEDTSCLLSVSEDCLYLNVYTPLDSSSSVNRTNYAVMIWIHGGHYISGSAADFDPTEIINFNQDVIVVTINYRLGLLGTFYDTAYNTNIKGNQGFLDQKMAIKWVYDNIAFFGGDPSRITLFGESAGADSAGFHLLYNNEYVSGGILQSPPFGMAYRRPESWKDVSSSFSVLLNCTDDNHLICWQSVDWLAIVQAQYDSSILGIWEYLSIQYTPTVETDMLLNTPIVGFSDPNIIDKIPPFIIGINEEEGFLWIPENGKQIINHEIIFYILYAEFGDPQLASLVLDYYELDESTINADEILGHIQTWFVFKCPARNVLSNQMNSNNVWYYNLNVIHDELFRYWFDSSYCYDNTCHGADIIFTFLPKMDGIEYDKKSKLISKHIHKYWTNFAKTGNPNYNNIEETSTLDENIPFWVNYDQDEKVLVFQDSWHIQSQYVNHHICRFWDQVGYAGDFCTDCDQSILSKDCNEIDIDGYLLDCSNEFEYTNGQIKGLKSDINYIKKNMINSKTIINIYNQIEQVQNGITSQIRSEIEYYSFDQYQFAHASKNINNNLYQYGLSSEKQNYLIMFLLISNLLMLIIIFILCLYCNKFKNQSYQKITGISTTDTEYQ